jgi:hypothetical protein
MISKESYLVRSIPFRVLKKGFTRVLVISEKGERKSLEPVPSIEFEEGDYLLRRTLIGEGHVEIDYSKMGDPSKRRYFSGMNSNIFSNK